MLSRWAALAFAVSLAAGPALAGDFVVRTVGAATAIAVDRDSIHTNGRYRTGWTYVFYRERNLLGGRRTQISAILELADCKTFSSRPLKVTHYLQDGRTLERFGPERAWTEPLRGSSTDMMLKAMCAAPDSGWARRKADTVFDLYRQVWR